MKKLIVSTSPHICSPKTTGQIMLDVIIALLPATIAAVWLSISLGYKEWYNSILLILVCIGAAVASEALFNLITKKEQTISDLSAVVTGLLLGLNLSISVPLWQAALGSVFAIVVVKCLFGGIGCNFANPAITARIFMLIAFEKMTETAVSDLVAGATPLAVLGEGGKNLPSMLDLFLGKYGGAMGETCTLALLIGGVYLVARKVISWHTPVVFIGTVFVLTFLFGGMDVELSLQHILSGGLFLGAIFMATDYATTPNTRWGKVIFGFGCGLITVLIRLKGSYPEGVSFSILLMNILTPYIERWTTSKPFGGGVKG